MHGKVFRCDDPFWDSFYPPNGFNCRCDVIPLTEDEINKIEHYTLQPKLDKDGQQVVINGIPQYEHVLTKIERCQSDSSNLKYKDATATVNGRKMTYKKSVYIDPKTGVETSTDRGWNYNPGKAVYFEPDLTKYDKQFVDAYLKMKAEFDKNWHRLSADAAGNGSVYAIGVLSKGESKIIKKLFDKIKDSEIKTGCDLSIYDYGTDAEINGELLRSEKKFSRNTIAISKKQYPELKSAFEKIINKTKNPNKNIVLTDAEITALTVYFHETVHNLQSKTLFDSDLSNVQIKLVECLVECLARKMTIDFIKMKFGIDSVIIEGNYDKYYSVFAKYSKNIDYDAMRNLIKNNQFNDIELELYKLLGITKTEQLIIVDEIATKLQRKH